MKAPAEADENERVDVLVPPEESVTFAWLRDAVGPDGETDAESVIVPEKLFRLLSLIVEVTEGPTKTVRLVGLAAMLKSLWDVVFCTVTVLDDCPDKPVESVTFRVTEYEP